MDGKSCVLISFCIAFVVGNVAIGFAQQEVAWENPLQIQSCEISFKMTQKGLFSSR